jgi:hypothetical protein
MIDAMSDRQSAVLKWVFVGTHVACTEDAEDIKDLPSWISVSVASLPVTAMFGYS